MEQVEYLSQQMNSGKGSASNSNSNNKKEAKPVKDQVRPYIIRFIWIFYYK